MTSTCERITRVGPSQANNATISAIIVTDMVPGIEIAIITSTSSAGTVRSMSTVERVNRIEKAAVIAGEKGENRSDRHTDGAGNQADVDGLRCAFRHDSQDVLAQPVGAEPVFGGGFLAGSVGERSGIFRIGYEGSNYDEENDNRAAASTQRSTSCCAAYRGRDRAAYWRLAAARLAVR